MYKKIPAELKAEKAWVNVWNRSKIPMQTAQKKAASASSPETWGAFDEAVKNVEQGTYDGIGYVFHNTGLVGIDIDTGFEDGFLSPLAVDILTHCRSYCEKSRSGRGFHILLRGKLPFKGKNNRKGLEVYRESRYFIMTGNVMFWDTIIENQEAIDYILQTYFADTPSEAQNQATGRIYSPAYKKPANGKIFVKPSYPTITEGGRNISLTSLAGQLHTQGYNKDQILQELLQANETACKPPLDASEVQAIVNSVTRYRRKRE